MSVKIFSNKTFLYALAFFIAVLGAACSGQPVGQGNGTTSGGGGAIQIQGSGSTFVKPIMDKWTSEYGKINSGIRIDYQGTGSGAGIKAIQNQTADFGATDAAMNADELKQTPDIIHVPLVLGAVVLTYNLPDVKEPLKLSPDVIADIYLGKIKKWNDERIKKDNPTAQLPDADITPVFRSDGSGTSFVLTDYLSKASPDWKGAIGATKNPQLPTGVGIGAKGNEGVMGQVKQTPNTIGYVELTFAKANNLPTALIKNGSGNFIEPNSETVTNAAAEMATQMPDDLRMEITNANGATAYPIAGMVYALVYKDQKDAAKGKALVDFLWWVTHDGEKYVRDLHYAPIPGEMVKRVETKLNSVTGGGKNLRQ